jgi:hypothetical protein
MGVNNEIDWRLATMNEVKDDEGYAGPTHETPTRLLPKPTLAPPTEGWTYLYNSPKWHYFRGGRSLCKRWMTFGSEFEQGMDKSPDNCKGCMTALEKERAKAKK